MTGKWNTVSSHQYRPCAVESTNGYKLRERRKQPKPGWKNHTSLLTSLATAEMPAAFCLALSHTFVLGSSNDNHTLKHQTQNHFAKISKRGYLFPTLTLPFSFSFKASTQKFEKSRKVFLLTKTSFSEKKVTSEVLWKNRHLTKPLAQEQRCVSGLAPSPGPRWNYPTYKIIPEQGCCLKELINPWSKLWTFCYY